MANVSNLFNLSSQVGAAPSAGVGGAQGSSYGSLLPGNVYPSVASVNPANGVSNMQKSNTGSLNLSNVKTGVGVLGTSTQTQPTNTAPTNNNNNNNNSGGSGNSLLDQFRALYGANETMPPGWRPPGYQADDAEIMAQINDAYNSSYDYFNQAENNLRGQYPQVQDQINADYNLNDKMLRDNNAYNSAQLNVQGDQAAQGNEKQSAAIRRLYQELGMGYQQRFGGSTSAGQAASELANIEQQRQSGQLGQQYNNTVQQLAVQRQKLDTEFQNSTQKLLQDKTNALTQAQQDFTNNLLKITQARAETDQNKAQARLSALMDYRNKVFTIEQQNQQFQQTLAAQKQAAELNLQAYNQTGSSAVSAANTAGSTFQSQTANNPTSGLTIGGLQQGFQNNGLTPLTGSKNDDWLTGIVSGVKNSWDFLTK